MIEWKPISTVPKDRRVLILFSNAVPAPFLEDVRYVWFGQLTELGRSRAEWWVDADVPNKPDLNSEKEN